MLISINVKTIKRFKFEKIRLGSFSQLVEYCDVRLNTDLYYWFTRTILFATLKRLISKTMVKIYTFKTIHNSIYKFISLIVKRIFFLSFQFKISPIKIFHQRSFNYHKSINYCFFATMKEAKICMCYWNFTAHVKLSKQKLLK